LFVKSSSSLSGGKIVTEPLAALNTGEMKRSRDGEHEGLCWKCSKAGACRLPRASDLPVVECGTYEASQPTRIPTAGSSIKPHRHQVEREYKGLCSDCEVRDDCNFSKPESGVWHCKHYR
jgi:hypothetical protein